MSRAARKGSHATAAAMTRISSSASGFAYLWVLMIVAFMGIGLVAAVTIDSTASQREKEQELVAVGHQFRGAIARYHETQVPGGKSEYPATLDDLLRDNRFPFVRRHLRKVFVDPMTSKPEWGLLRVGGRIVGVHSMSEKMPIKQDRFEPEDMALRGKSKYSDWVFTYPPDLQLQDAAKVSDAAASALAPAARAASAISDPPSLAASEPRP